MPAKDAYGRSYAHSDTLKAGDIVTVDVSFEGCFVPWTQHKVVVVGDELAIVHNAPECGACGGNEGDCPHMLSGQEDEDGYLIGIYLGTVSAP